MLYDDYAAIAQRYKAQYGPRVLVAYEVGKFYEWYNCDRDLGCDVRGVCDLLNVQCTRKSKAVPDISRTNPLLGGVPVCAFPKYVPLLLEDDYTIVLVKQTSPPPDVRREVTEIMSRGTYVGSMIDGSIQRNDDDNGGGGNTTPPSAVCMCLFLDWHVEGLAKDRHVLHAGCALSDVTTGACECHEINATGRDLNFAHDEIYRHVQESLPSEVVLLGYRIPGFDVAGFVRHIGVDPASVRDRLCEKVTMTDDKKDLDQDGQGFAAQLKRLTSIRHQEHVLRGVYPDTGFLSAVEALDLECRPHACTAFVGLLQFIKEHNEVVIRGMRRPTTMSRESLGDGEDENDPEVNIRDRDRDRDRRLLLSYNAAQQLDIVEGYRSSSSSRSTRSTTGTGSASLCSSAAATLTNLLNSCRTSVGRRFLRQQLLEPLVDAVAIRSRLEAVELRLKDPEALRTERALLGEVADLERLFRKIALRSACPYDFLTIDASLEALCKSNARCEENHEIDIRALRETYLEVLDVEGLVASLETQRVTGATSISTMNMFVKNVFRRGAFPDIDAAQVEADEARACFRELVSRFNSIVKVPANSPPAFRLETSTTNEPLPKPTPTPRPLSSRTASKPIVAAEGGGHRVTYSVAATSKRCETLISTCRRAGGARQRWWTREEMLLRQGAHDDPVSAERQAESMELDPGVFEARSVNNTTSHVYHPRLVEWSERLQKAEDRLRSLSESALRGLVDTVFERHEEGMLRIIDLLARTDYACACADNARRYRHVRPTIVSLSSQKPQTKRMTPSWLHATRLRHPIVEVINDKTPHVPNDVYLREEQKDEKTSSASPCGMLLYGMNAAGKSCLMKAVALAVVMAQAGMYVAADVFRLAPFRQVFTRIQSHDDISRGQSTFMIEMSELRNILKRCDATSLVIGDEVCSGTESVSALAIVGASVQCLLDRSVPFLFATHLHELTRLLKIDREEGEYDNYQNDPSKPEIKRLRVCHLRVFYDSSTKRLVYDRRLCEGQGTTVYGLEVCKALDMDSAFLDSAHALRNRILLPEPDAWHARASRYNARVLMDTCAVCRTRAATETHHVLPQKDADADGFIGTFHKNSAFNLVPLCEKCHLSVHDGKINIEGYVQTSSGPEFRVYRSNTAKASA
jgi:DNA mismatch repair protein MutS